MSTPTLPGLDASAGMYAALTAISTIQRSAHHDGLRRICSQTLWTNGSTAGVIGSG